jgi:hypothetical protein
VKLRGEDTVEAYREWFKAEIREGLKQRYELGKFFFSVSVGTIGVLAAISKLSNARIRILLILSAVFLFSSILLALSLAVPRTQRIHGGADLDKIYVARNRWILYHIWGWFLLWLVGAVLGAIGAWG